MEVLVTGASGFIGRPAVAELLRRGFAVHGVGRDEPEDLEIDAWHSVDVLDGLAFDLLVREISPSHLLHLAWCTEHGRFWDDPTNDDWARATARLAASFRDAGGARMVFAGSCRQYDWSEAALAPDGLARERTTRRAPSTRYGRAKETTTRELGAIATKTGLAVATGLVFFPFGPYEKLERLVPSVTRRLLAGKVAETTLGTQVRDFIHVDDCAGALAALVDSEATGPFNIGSGIGTRVGDVSTMIARILAREDLLRPGALPMRDDEPAHLVADVTRMRDEVGFTPAFDLEAGLRDAIDWWRARPDQALQK